MSTCTIDAAPRADSTTKPGAWTLGVNLRLVSLSLSFAGMAEPKLPLDRAARIITEAAELAQAAEQLAALAREADGAGAAVEQVRASIARLQALAAR